MLAVQRVICRSLSIVPPLHCFVHEDLLVCALGSAAVLCWRNSLPHFMLHLSCVLSDEHSLGL